jgi:hypothetical protein
VRRFRSPWSLRHSPTHNLRNRLLPPPSTPSASSTPPRGANQSHPSFINTVEDRIGSRKSANQSIFTRALTPPFVVKISAYRTLIQSSAPNKEQIAAKIYHHESRASLLGGQPFTGGFHHREGYSTVSKQKNSTMYLPNTFWSWSFLIVTLVQAAIILGFES